MKEERDSSVSVVIPTLNYGRFVAAAVESVLTQTRRPKEVIVVDGGSTDDTLDRLQAFGDAIVLIQQTDRGLPAQRNAGAAAASGDLVAFLDADDIWLPTKLERQLQRLDEAPEAALVYCGMEIFVESGATVGQLLDGPEGWVWPDMLLSRRAWVVGPGSTAVVRAVAFTEIGGFDCAMTNLEDWEFCLRLAMRYPIARVAEPLVRYRLHSSNRHRDLRAYEANLRHAYDKVFASADASIESVRRRAYANLHLVLSGAYRRAHEWPACARHFTRAALLDPIGAVRRALHLGRQPQGWLQPAPH